MMATSVLLRIFVISCLCLSLPAMSEAEDEVSSLFQTGVSYLQQGNFSACEQVFKQLAAEPNCDGCLLNLITCQAGNSNFVGCVQTVDKFLALTHNEALAVFALSLKATCLSQQQNYSGCVAVSDKAQTLINNQNTHLAYGLLLANKAECLSKLGLFHECTLASSQALDQPNELTSHYLAFNNKAYCLKEQGDYAGCIEVSDQMLSRVNNPDYVIEGLNHKATCQAFMQDYSGCVDTYEKLLKYSNTSVNWINKANCLAMQHDFDGCIEAADQGLALGENNQEAQVIRDNCVFGKENPEEITVHMAFLSL